MQLAAQLQLLQSQLNILNDKHHYIIPTICNNFVRKYQQNILTNTDQLAQQLKVVLQQIDIYSQYAYETINKYQCLNKLQALVRSIIQGQTSILVYFGNVVGQSLRQKNNYQEKLQNLNSRVHQRCHSCTKPLKRVQIENIQDQIGLKFRDAYSYFTHDIDELNKLSQEASLIFRKKILNIEGITEEEYFHKFQKIKQNISATIEHVTSSLHKITIFQDKFAQFQEHQYVMSKNQKQKFNDNKFDSKKYMIDLAKHLYNSIKQLEDKLNRIKTFFKTSVSRETQTKNQFDQCTPQKLHQLQDALSKSEIEKKQIQLYMASVDQQLTQTKQKLKSCQQKLFALRQQKQKTDEKAKALEVQLEVRNDYQKAVQKKSQKVLQIQKLLRTQKAKKSFILTQHSKQADPINMGSLNQKNNKKTDQAKQSQTAEVVKKQQKKNIITKKYQNSITAKKQNDIEVFQQKQLNGKSPAYRTSPKIKTDHSAFSQDSELNRRNLHLSQNIRNSVSTKNEEIYKHKKNQNQRPAFQSIQNEYMKKQIIQKVDYPQSSGLISVREFHIFKVFSLFIPNYLAISNLSRKIQSQPKPAPQSLNYTYWAQKLYQNLCNSTQNLSSSLSLEQFVEKIENFVQNATSPKSLNQSKKQTPQKIKIIGSVNQKSKTQSLSKFNEKDMKSTNRTSSKNFFELAAIKPHDNIDKPNLNFTKKNFKNTRYQTNFEQVFEDKIRKHQVRKSLNSLQQLRNMKQNKFSLNGLINIDSLANKGHILQNLPLLKKRNRQQSLTFNRQRLGDEQLVEYQVSEAESDQFTQQDIKNIFLSLQNAFKVGQTSLKGRKRQISLSDTEQFFHPQQINYIKHFFTRLASVHLNNKDGYEKIKMFLLCPYDYVVTQMSKLNLIKSNSCSSAMRQSLKNIVILHRMCVTRGEICKHLKRFLGKVVHIENIKQQ